MQELAGVIAVVTGANSGVGLAATRLLAEAGVGVTLVCRSRERGGTARAEVATRATGEAPALEITDLSRLDDVRGLAGRLADRHERIDILVNNAAVWRARREISPDGYEVTLATNHLGHFVLTGLLLERLRSGRGRIVNVSSEAHRNADIRRAGLETIIRGDAWAGGRRAYSDSKLANVLFTNELVRRHGGSGITANALHPGVLATRIWNQNLSPASIVMRLFKPLLGSPETGGKAVFRLSADPALESVTGRYFKVEHEVGTSADAADDGLAVELWDLSGRLTGLAY